MTFRRPAFLPVFHRAWIAFASAVLLASCTVVPAPTSYSYQPTTCPPGVAANTQLPAGQQPQAMTQDGQPVPAPQAGAPQVQGQPAACYTAVPNGYTYNYYPGTPAYPAYYPYSYPYYYGPYYGPSVVVGAGWGWRHHH
ncbi:MAG TPA: hypothetical protein VGG27_11810 [Magnetospirillaceae bacterium]|jgi:hypothetical protein